MTAVGAVHDIIHLANEDKPRLSPLTAEEFLKLEIPPRRLILEPWLAEKGGAMIYSPRGTGKTLFAMTLAYTIATGAEFLGFRVPSPRKVLYIDGEMPAAEMQKCLAAIVAGFDQQPPDPTYLRFLSSDLTEFGLPDLGTLDGQAALDAQVGDAEVVIVDNISTLVRCGVENEAESWRPVQAWFLSHRRAGRSVVFIHHAGKSGAQRGTSKREDVPDTVMALKRPADYSPVEGARFEVHFEKARGIYGDAAMPFEARYEVRNDKAVWTRRVITDSDAECVAGAIRKGSSIRKVAKALGMSKSAVERAKKRATANGLLDG